MKRGAVSVQIHTLSAALRQQFGGKVYKLALTANVTCPNRDGTIGTRGCLFCSEKGSGEFAAVGADIHQQMEEAKKRVAFKAGKHPRYIAYFQSFTNTYAPLSYLREIFFAAIEPDDVAVLSIATRPDCLGEKVLALLEELAQHKPVWVELGLQSIHPATAKLIRRGYELPVFERAVEELKKRAITVIAHQIIGLPGETEEMIYQTAAYLARIGVEGVKFHLLYVSEGTDLADMWRIGKVKTLTQEEYIHLLAGCVRRQRTETVIHRMTGDGDKRTLLAPLWSADKKRVLQAIETYFTENRVVQGELYGQ